MILVLTGGTGGAKFVQGLARVVPPEEITLVVNTGDDMIWWGLHVSPDVDSITYVLGEVLSRDRGWGFDGDSFRCLERMRALGEKGWFQVGDLDLATHLRRTQLLNEGRTLTEATAQICEAMGIRSRILPMSDQSVETRVTTEIGEISFQEYFVRDRHRASVRAVRFVGASASLPSPGVIEAIKDAEMILLAPSNPLTSIGPVLAVPGIRNALCSTGAPIAAVSPIVGGAAVSGPAGEMLRMQNLPVSAVGIAETYRDFLDLLVADTQDEALEPQIREVGIAVSYTHTMMRTIDDKISLADFVIKKAKKYSKVAGRAGGVA